jgi:hypothetical protein
MTELEFKIDRFNTEINHNLILIGPPDKKLTNSMQQVSSFDGNSRRKKIVVFLWKPKVHCRVYSSS